MTMSSAKNWAALTDADWERIDRGGWQQTSYVKLHFDEHEAFTSLYFLELGRTAEQLQRAARTLLQGAGYGHILRIKGFIPENGGWLELNAARMNDPAADPKRSGGTDRHRRRAG